MRNLIYSLENKPFLSDDTINDEFIQIFGKELYIFKEFQQKPIKIELNEKVYQLLLFFKKEIHKRIIFNEDELYDV